mgnify:CR=1 FL=1
MTTRDKVLAIRAKQGGRMEVTEATDLVRRMAQNGAAWANAGGKASKVRLREERVVIGKLLAGLLGRLPTPSEIEEARAG